MSLCESAWFSRLYFVSYLLLQFYSVLGYLMQCYDPVHAVSDLATLFIFSSFSFLLRNT